MKTSALLFAAALVCAPFTMTQAQESTNMFVLSDDHSSASLTAEASIISGDNPISVTYFKGTGADPAEETTSYTGNGLGNQGNKIPTEDTPNYYIFDFSQSVEFGKIAINWEGATRPAQYYIYVSDDKETWEQVGSYSTTDQAQVWDNWIAPDFTDPIIGRYFKISITATTNTNYATRIDGFRIEELRIPSAIKIHSQINGFNDPWVYGSVLTVGESATISASVYDQNGKIMTDIVPSITSNASESEWSDGIYTPISVGTADFTASYANMSETLIFHTTDLANFITSDKYKEFSSSSTNTNVNYNNIVDGESSLTDHANSQITIAAADGQSENFVLTKLERIYDIENIAIYWDSAPDKFKISISLDGDNWSEIAAVDYTNAASGIHLWSRIAIPSPTLAKYIKIETEGIKTGYGLQLGALKLYGEGEESIPTSISISSSNGTALCAGESTTFVPTVFDQFGAIMENVVLTWTHNAIPENWDENTLTYTASERVAGGEGVTFTASVIVGEGENVKTVSGEIVLKGFNIEHYLFDSNLHEYYKNAGIDLRKEAVAAVRTSTNIETGRPDKTSLFDGGKELTSRGAGYRLMADQGTPRDAQGEIIVTLYDPVTIEAIVLDWDGASPSEYTIEISNHGEVWTEVAHLENLESPGVGQSFQRRLGVRYDKPVTLIRVKTLGNATNWGLQLLDFKAYGTYANVDPAYLTLSPYVNVAYTTTTIVDDVEETKTVVNDHPNTVAFYTSGSGDQFGQEKVYLNPKYQTANKANFHLKTGDKVTYTVSRVDGEIDHAKDYTLDADNHTIIFHTLGLFDIAAESTKGEATVNAETRIKTVRHNAMVVAGLEELPDLNVRFLEADTENETHSEQNRAAEVLMSGRTDTDGGVSGSINLSQNDKVYDVLIDFGKVIDIPAVEILWEGACPQRYSLSVGREADFSDAQTVDHFDPMRRAMVDRPRFDRFAVETPEAYEAPSTEEQPAQIASRAEAADPKDGSRQAIRYVKLHNIVLDPWMGNVWGAKLAEVTPYFDPTKSPELPTGIDDINADNNADCPVEYYTLQGIRVDQPSTGTIVIRRQGTSVKKILVK